MSDDSVSSIIPQIDSPLAPLPDPPPTPKQEGSIERIKNHAIRRMEALAIFFIDLVFLGLVYLSGIGIENIVATILKLSLGGIIGTSSEVSTFFQWWEERLAIVTILAYVAYTVYSAYRLTKRMIALEKNPDAPLN